MRLFTYVIPFDTGFAPNPFHGYCTLACCKPAIRRAARPGDWIVGLTPKGRGNRIVYAMHVAQRLPFAEYWHDPRFTLKRSDLRSHDRERHCGDNIYEPIGGGGYRQHAGAHTAEHQQHDLGGKFVLVATDYTYYGANAIQLTPQFTGIVPGRAHRCNFEPEVVQEFVRFIGALRFGVHGEPAIWPPQWAGPCAGTAKDKPGARSLQCTTTPPCSH